MASIKIQELAASRGAAGISVCGCGAVWASAGTQLKASVTAAAKATAAARKRRAERPAASKEKFVTNAFIT
ncbi:hypothetical protein GCM10022228_18080 [Halomonas cibimaris]|uniref:Uncharacterized protein n=1 Tax=Halomonas cibimaris TaxID=657012 RepID=A0ABP7LUS8_9GAMM